VTAIIAALDWFQDNWHSHLVIHSDSTSAIARAQQVGAAPGQGATEAIWRTLKQISAEGCTTEIQWVKGQSGFPGNERADVLAGRAAEKLAPAKYMSLTFLKLRISEGFSRAKERWHEDPAHHGRPPRRR
jgi:ribonuclease HI